MKKNNVILILLLSILLVAYQNCQRKGAQKGFDVPGLACNSNGVISNTVSYADVKSQVFERVCIDCHTSGTGLPNWMIQSEAKLFSDRIKKRVLDKTMPPPNARINSLSDSEISLVASWAAGLPATGDGPDPCMSDTVPTEPITDNPTPPINTPPVDSPPTTEPPVCTDPSQTLDIVSYLEDVRPNIFQAVCFQCHGAIGGLPNWMSYSVAFGKKDVILARVQNGTMPPPNATINSLTTAQKQLITDWVADGAEFTKLLCDVPTEPDPIPPPADPEPPANPTYDEHLKPQIFTLICGACHGNDPDLPNWQIYEEAENRADKIKREVEDGNMPPPSTGIILTDNQKELIYRWVDQGAVK